MEHSLTCVKRKGLKWTFKQCLCIPPFHHGPFPNSIKILFFGPLFDLWFGYILTHSHDAVTLNWHESCKVIIYWLFQTPLLWQFSAKKRFLEYGHLIASVCNYNCWFQMIVDGLMSLLSSRGQWRVVSCHSTTILFFHCHGTTSALLCPSILSKLHFPTCMVLAPVCLGVGGGWESLGRHHAREGGKGEKCCVGTHLPPWHFPECVALMFMDSALW